MANDLEPVDPTGATGGILDKIKEVIGAVNLPKIVAGPAGEAISRLIAGGADIPAAWLEQRAKAIRNKTDGQTLVSKTLAGAAAELVRNDPALVQRAADAFIAKEIRHQHNRETIAVKAIEHLKETPDAETIKPDDDWLNVFARYAEDASSERLQDLWARILSGQLKRPKTFSLSTLRFAAELDEETATLFEKWSTNVVDADFIPFIPNEGAGFTELIRLEDAGLITGVTGQINKMYKDPSLPEEIKALPLHFAFKEYDLVVMVMRPFNLNLRAALLTRVGKEIYEITKAEDSPDAIQSFANNFPKEQVQNIVRIKRSDRTTHSLWSKPPETHPNPAS